MQRNKKHRRRRVGMTLIEIMVVVVIMAMMAAGVGISVMKAKETANKNIARSGVRAIATAVQAYMLEHPDKGCPTVDELRASGVLTPGTEPKDPWGHDYKIDCGDENLQVRSFGKDAEPDSNDDITLL